MEVLPIFVIAVTQFPPNGMSEGWFMNVVSKSSLSILDPNRLYPLSMAKSTESQLADVNVKLLSGAVEYSRRI